MQLLRSSILSTGLLLGFSSVASAGGDWQTVSLDNNPAFTIDVPAAVGTAYTPKERDPDLDEVMHFMMETADGGGLICLMSRSAKGTAKEEKKFRAMLATPRRNVMCDDDKAKNLTIGGSKSLTIDGLTAAECTASYTVEDSPLAGRIINPTEILGAKNHYLLTCYYVTDSQDEATAKWVLTWSKTVTHIKESVRLPADEKKRR